MRRLLTMLALCATAILALAPAALAQQGTDLDCSQLGASGASPEAVQAEAQGILAADPSDPNALDADGDGTACEFEASSTGEVAFEDGSGFVSDVAAPAAEYEGEEPRADLDCADFTSGAEAQAALEAGASDLDADGDGIACNELFTEDPPLTAEEPAQYEAPRSPSVEVAPVAPPPGADSPVFQPTEPDVAETVTPQASTPEAPEASAPQAPETATPVPPAPRPASAQKELPATGGSDLLAPALAGGAILLLLGLGGAAAAGRRA